MSTSTAFGDGRQAFLNAFVFESVPASASLMRAIDVLREANRLEKSSLSKSAPTGFIKQRWPAPPVTRRLAPNSQLLCGLVDAQAGCRKEDDPSAFRQLLWRECAAPDHSVPVHAQPTVAPVKPVSRQIPSLADREDRLASPPDLRLWPRAPRLRLRETVTNETRFSVAHQPGRRFQRGGPTGLSGRDDP